MLSKRDCAVLKEKVLHLKAFGMEMSKFAKSHKDFTQRTTRLSAEQLPAVVPQKKRRARKPNWHTRIFGIT